MKPRNKPGTEKDGLFCPFFQRIGACMHGDACSRMHIRPVVSRTLLLCNLYPNPHRFISLLPTNMLYIDEKTLKCNFDDFYVDIYEELRTFGPITDMLVADNLAEHLIGNILVRFERIEDAVSAFNSLRGRYYAGRPIDAQFSPVESLSSAICKQSRDGMCKHGDTCNFIHPKEPSLEISGICLLLHSYNSETKPKPRNIDNDYHERDYHRPQRDYSENRGRYNDRYPDRSRYQNDRGHRNERDDYRDDYRSGNRREYYDRGHRY